MGPMDIAMDRQGFRMSEYIQRKPPVTVCPDCSSTTVYILYVLTQVDTKAGDF